MQNKNKKKILVVDDKPENLHVLINILKDSYAVIVATNGEKALELAKRDPHPDIILLDIIMPGLDGYEVCKQLKKDHPTVDIPVVFVTSKTKEEDEEVGIKLGAVGYIRKPVTPEEVIKSIREHI